jgi:Fe-S-cluster containining protein
MSESTPPENSYDPEFPDPVERAKHDFDEDGEHDPDECEECLARTATIHSTCRCGQCCQLIVEVSLRDAEREPKIRELGSPIYAPAELTESGKRELDGYLLNTGKDNACVFLDQATNLCSIHPTRPLVCRLFDCDGEGRQQLIDLGMLPADRER